MIQQKMDYIHDNPVKEGIVEHQEDYIYSSARDYYEGKGYWNRALLIEENELDQVPGCDFSF